jgi:hypothetical protein
VAPARRINNLACPTRSKRPIEFQCLFSRLSHHLWRLLRPVAAVGSSPMPSISQPRRFPAMRPAPTVECGSLFWPWFDSHRGRSNHSDQRALPHNGEAVVSIIVVQSPTTSFLL